MIYTTTFHSPLGAMVITASDDHLLGLEFGVGERRDRLPLLDYVKEQLDEYYRGARRAFSLPLKAVGTPFQMKVWDALLTIPYGETRSYGEIAAQIGNPKACRAVGMANNRNPISIIIPCHRVIGSDGSLVGYGGGMEKKVWLLDFEARHRDQ
ncbi:MAG TPA: methylated-DNA--[protein]-cysteine S-methyltransferase [Sphaerochaeta sp.]|jgi:methylated-DNA-[protein]-cysteine S-methyltransferase|nr:methylated-DNA--[protein]-cysteine S-methyltransferase [Sphaerochaeta sp.]HPZ15515.1 methylated-DNA--[protein]-cysteine S-methyltransferase [Sphaerochaeta sp.]